MGGGIEWEPEKIPNKNNILGAWYGGGDVCQNEIQAESLEVAYAYHISDINCFYVH